MKNRAFALLIGAATIATPAFPDDVYVRGHYRQDGTYVQPHVRSSPNSTRSDNYGPSEGIRTFGSYPSYSAPRTRDHDNDGVPNYRDRDDDNDVVHDDRDRLQYGRTYRPYGGY